MIRVNSRAGDVASMAPANTAPLQVVSFILWQRRGSSDSAADAFEKLGRASGLPHRFSSPDGRLLLAYSTREAMASSPDPAVSPRFSLVCGDPGEFRPADIPEALGSAALIECDLQAGEAGILNSIVGLPAVYLYETESHRALTSDVQLLAGLFAGELSFDPDGLADLCTYGYPVDFRTLFRNVRLLAGGTRASLDASGHLHCEQGWRFPAPDPLDKPGSYAALQEETFRRVLGQMDLSGAFLSLTAGLDTRAILAELVATERSIPAFTMSGPNWTVDARAAHALCRAYGIRHDVILLDANFLRSLPDLVREASRLSGGLASLEQSHDLYLYRRLGREFSARISGNMGNQLGRKGVEHVSMRSADSSLLNPELHKRAHERSRSPWYQEGLKKTAVYEFLLQHEAPFTLAGNFSIGHHFAVQQSPYASRALFELCPRQPVEREAATPSSAWQLRLNDIRHRFLGAPADRSFQRRLISETGGFVASYPINWGWRAKGGVSPAGMMRGMLSLADAFAVRQHMDSGPAGAVLAAAGITGLHEYRNWKLWMRTSLREFVHDTLLSAQVRESGIFDAAMLERMIEEHYTDKANHHNALVFALDLGLAVQEFGARYR